MFLISFEDQGKATKNIATAETTKLAKRCVEDHFGQEIPAEAFELDEEQRIVYCFGDAQYVIESLPHWS